MQNEPTLICLKGDIINCDVQIQYITYILDQVRFVGPFGDVGRWDAFDQDASNTNHHPFYDPDPHPVYQGEKDSTKLCFS